MKRKQKKNQNMKNLQQDKKEKNILKISEKIIKRLWNLKEKKENKNLQNNRKRKNQNYHKLIRPLKLSKIKLQELY